MSAAGTRSWRGDEYQLRIALHYLIRLLNNEFSGLQAESTGLPGQDGAVSVDDVVALLPDGTREYVQAKKNSPNHESWRLKDKVLRDELKKARDQLERDPTGTVRFFSRSPFGEFRKLQEEALLYPDCAAFEREAGQAVKASLAELASLFERSDAETLALLQRMAFGATREFDDWDAENKKDLERVLPACSTALSVLERFLASHQSRLRGSKFVINRSDVLDELARHNLRPAPLYGEQETLDLFRRASQIGRTWPRDIAGTKLRRAELDIVLSHIASSTKTVLIAAGPGSGKTCLLLDVADELEAECVKGVLFIKGDRFAGVDDEARLHGNGLPDDIVGRCARLAVSRSVVVLLDSLDVLSLSRNHGSLRVFLGLLERLEKLEGVTVVVACREFDLKYDRQLRAREWQARVPLGLLSFADDVAPLLMKWNVDVSTLNEDLRSLLSVPQHLSLFSRLVKNREVPNVVSSFQLYERFFDDVVARDPNLGDQILQALEHLAANGIHQRRQTFPRASSNLTGDAVQKLISSGILIEGETGALAFTHQTIPESLAVRKSLREGQTLAAFIVNQPPLPFVRPTVRTFLFCLRSQDRKTFRRQAWEVLAHPDIAYHLKRLIDESLAETQPAHSDWPLVRRLFTEKPTLFRRTLSQARGSAWFLLLRDHWLPLIKRDEGAAEWRYQYLGGLGRWVKTHPREVVELWTDALDTGWSPNGATWRISISLSDLPDWTVDGVEKLFTLLIANSTDRDRLSKPLSSWISATDTGDKLLWQLMIRDEPNDAKNGQDRRLNIRCTPHSFVDDGFLLRRLERSDDLLTLATEHLDRAVVGDKTNGYSHASLHKTSWKRRHSRQDTLPADGATMLFGTIERALKKRSKENDDWWRTQEPKLRCSSDLGIRYALIEAYRANPSVNIAGIEAQLVDAQLFRFGQLEYEMGTLTADTYGYLSEAIQDKNQDMLLTLYDDRRSDDGALPDWALRKIYEYALWIPRPFRSPRMTAFMERWQDDFGAVRPSPRIHMWGGAVGAPISRRQLADLDTGAILRLLRHYLGGGPHDTELIEQGGFVGGIEQVQSTLRECAAHEPSRFLGLLSEDFDEELASAFASSIYEGVANHLRYLAGSLSAPEGWTRDDGTPAPETFVDALLKFAEDALAGSRTLSPELEDSVSYALRAVAETTESEETAERMTLALWRLVKSESPDAEPDQDHVALGVVSLNSTRGMLAGTAMSLYCRWLELNKPIPRLLAPLLRRLAADPAMGVRVSILNGLALLTHHSPEFGWTLFDDAFRERQGVLWVEAEQLLYHSYRLSFDRVCPLLARIASEAPEAGGETYGRLATLAYLADHDITNGRPFVALATTDPIRQGIAQVLTANLGSGSAAAKCRAALIEMLRDSQCSAAAAVALSREMGSEDEDGIVDPELVLECARALSSSGQGAETWGLCKWLERNCRQYPLVALEVCETLVATGEENESLRFSTEMVPVLLEVLREADETDDPKLIARAVNVQDHFLRLEVQGVDELLDEAAFC